MSVHTHSGHERRAVVRDAGLPGISAISILAGIVAAYGTFAIVAAVVGAIAHAADADTEFRSNDWTGSGATALLISAVSLFIAYLFGGYIAGRMARRRGVAHGVAVFVISIIVAALAGWLVRIFTDDADIRRNLRSIGAPTTWDQVSGVAIVGVIVALAAMLVGAILGGGLGDRWHTKLERRAVDPAYGPDDEAYRDSDAYRHADARRDVDSRRDVDADRDADGRRDLDERRDVDARRDDDAWHQSDARREGDVPREPVGASEAGTRDHAPAAGSEREAFERGRREAAEPGIGSARRDEPVDQPTTDRTTVAPGTDVRRD